MREVTLKHNTSVTSLRDLVNLSVLDVNGPLAGQSVSVTAAEGMKSSLSRELYTVVMSWFTSPRLKYFKLCQASCLISASYIIRRHIQELTAEFLCVRCFHLKMWTWSNPEVMIWKLSLWLLKYSSYSDISCFTVVCNQNSFVQIYCINKVVPTISTECRQVYL